MQKKIIWQRWEEPADSDHNDHEDDDFDTEDNEHGKPYPVIRTEYGHFVSVKIHAPLKNDLKLWVGNSNFDIGHKEKAIIEDVDGVEILDIFSAYKFRVGIGLAFDDKTVQKRIEKLLCEKYDNVFLTKQQSIDIKKHRIDLKAKELPWILYILPNGKYESISCENIDEYDKLVDQYIEVKKCLGGKLMLGYK
jgi:hypothetical protein